MLDTPMGTWEALPKLPGDRRSGATLVAAGPDPLVFGGGRGTSCATTPGSGTDPAVRPGSGHR